MSVKEKFEKLNERKEHYRTVDDDAILSLKEYYKIEDHEELLKYVKKNAINGDSLKETATGKESITWNNKQKESLEG